jgi:YggT family protein
MEIAILVISIAVKIIDVVIFLYSGLIIIRAILSWFQPDPANKFVQILHKLTDPVLEPIRSFIMEKLGLYMGGIDFSPLILILALGALNRLIHWGAVALLQSLISNG